MRMFTKMAAGGGAFALAAVAATMLPGQFTRAADHLDPPARTDPAVDATPDRAADIADVFAWYTPTSVVLALTFSGPQATTAPATYDRDVLYTINVSNDGSRTGAEFPIRVRFGPGTGPNEFGVQVTGLPGATDLVEVEGPVETPLTVDGITVQAGLFDDPFFFDLQGFRETLQTGTLIPTQAGQPFTIRNNRDFFAGQNDTAVVIEIPRDRIENGNNLVDVWATTARFGGNL